MISRFYPFNKYSLNISSFYNLVFFKYSTQIPEKVRVRFAPSPTGYLHLGGLRTALYNYLFAKKHNGVFVLRIEDTDQTRTVSDATQRIIETLQWAGIDYDEGPIKNGPYGPYIQSERKEIYQKYAEQLMEEGKAYKCFCTPQRLDLLRRQCMSSGQIPRYDNKCRHITRQQVEDKTIAGIPSVIRLKLEPRIEPWNDLVYGPCQSDASWNEGDLVIVKSDGFPTYHLANVVDDRLMQISHVLRGVEWQISTIKHLLLYKAFNWMPPLYAHLPLLKNKDGKKLSKRQNDDSNLSGYIATGFFPDAVLNLLTDSGSGFEVKDTSGFTISQLIENFDLQKLNTNSTCLDFDKLWLFNRMHLKRLIVNAFYEDRKLQRGTDAVENKSINNAVALVGKDWEKSAENMNGRSVECQVMKLYGREEENFECVYREKVSGVAEFVVDSGGKDKLYLLKVLKANMNDYRAEIDRLEVVLEWEMHDDSDLLCILYAAKDRISLISDLFKPSYSFLWFRPSFNDPDKIPFPVVKDKSTRLIKINQSDPVSIVSLPPDKISTLGKNNNKINNNKYVIDKNLVEVIKLLKNLISDLDQLSDSDYSVTGKLTKVIQQNFDSRTPNDRSLVEEEVEKTWSEKNRGISLVNEEVDKTRSGNGIVSLVYKSQSVKGKVLLVDEKERGQINYAEKMRWLRRLFGGSSVGPSISEMMSLLGKPKTLNRLKIVVQLFNANSDLR